MSNYALPPDTRVNNSSGHLADHQEIADWLSLANIFNVKNTVYGAVGDGTTDDTAAIQAAINAAEAVTGGADVIFPPGQYVISKPLLVTASGVRLLGMSGPGATGGGGGSGGGTFLAGHNTGGNQITGVLFSGAIICPSSSFSASGFSHSGCVVVDSTVHGASINRVTIENMNFYGGNAGLTTVDGISFYGHMDAMKVKNVTIFVFYSASSNGIGLYDDGSGNVPDGTWIQDCMIQFVGNDGIHGPFGDGEITRVHTQVVGGYGFWISDSSGYTGGSGGNIRLSDCRGDLSALDGFYFNVSCGGYMGLITVTGCSTQRNTNNGFHVKTSTGVETCPVYFSSCVAQGDGTDGASAGYRLSGPCAVSLAGSASHVNHNTEGDGNSYPKYGVVLAKDSASQSAVFATCQGGSFACQTAPFLLTDAPQPGSTVGVDTFTATISGQYSSSANYSHVTAW